MEYLISTHGEIKIRIADDVYKIEILAKQFDMDYETLKASILELPIGEPEKQLLLSEAAALTL